MKIEWVNNGKEFEPTKINVEMELEILQYLEENTKDMPKDSPRKNYLEFVETIYHVFNKVDKNVTREKIKNKLSATELGILFVAVRTKEQVKYTCPYCRKQFTHMEMNKVEAGDKNFQDSKPGTTETTEDD